MLNHLKKSTDLVRSRETLASSIKWGLCGLLPAAGFLYLHEFTEARRFTSILTQSATLNILAMLAMFCFVLVAVLRNVDHLLARKASIKSVVGIALILVGVPLFIVLVVFLAAAIKSDFGIAEQGLAGRLINVAVGLLLVLPPAVWGFRKYRF